MQTCTSEERNFVEARAKAALDARLAPTPTSSLFGRVTKTVASQ
jgi:hypothetical protein